jgi:hypothetical protein
MPASVIAHACGRSVAAERAALLSWLPAGLECREHIDEPGWCGLAAWAATGGLWLSGWPDQAPVAPAGPLASRLYAAAGLLADVTEQLGCRVEVDLPVVISGRAALAGYGRRGQTSTGGSCRLLPALDGWVAVNLARPSDLEAVPAIAGTGPGDDPWASLSAAVAASTADDLVSRAQLLGVAASEAGRYLPGVESPWPYAVIGEPRSRSAPSWTVVDLSAMWAGPLCAHLLGRAGARVIKVESVGRPDGSRFGDPAFYDWLHGGHASVAVNLASDGGRQQLRALLETADVVIEASRPRALQQLGIDAGSFVGEAPGRTWVSITGYGRTGPWSNRVAFGDDAAVAGGLVGLDDSGRPLFCADAVADPITGLFAALAAAASHAAGGGLLADVSMSGIAAYVAGQAAGSDGTLIDHEVEAKPASGWAVRHGADWFDVRPPVRPDRTPSAAGLGADTVAVLARAEQLGRDNRGSPGSRRRGPHARRSSISSAPP